MIWPANLCVFWSCLRLTASEVHHTSPSLIVSRTASLRHPTVNLAASDGAPTGQTQQGPLAPGRLPGGRLSPVFCQAFVQVTPDVLLCVCVCVCVWIRQYDLKMFITQTLCLCMLFSVCLCPEFAWEEDIDQQMLSSQNS